jgi:hypothetical protein
VPGHGPWVPGHGLWEKVWLEPLGPEKNDDGRSSRHLLPIIIFLAIFFNIFVVI